MKDVSNKELQRIFWNIFLNYKLILINLSLFNITNFSVYTLSKLFNWVTQFNGRFDVEFYGSRRHFNKTTIKNKLTWY